MSREKLADTLIKLAQHENANELIQMWLIKYEELLGKQMMLDLLDKQVKRG